MAHKNEILKLLSEESVTSDSIPTNNDGGIDEHMDGIDHHNDETNDYFDYPDTDTDEEEDEVGHFKRVTFGDDTMAYFNDELSNDSIVKNTKSNMKKFKAKPKKKMIFKQISLPWPFHNVQKIQNAGMRMLSKFASNSLLSTSITGLTPKKLQNAINSDKPAIQFSNTSASQSDKIKAATSKISAYIEHDECIFKSNKRFKKKKKKALEGNNNSMTNNNSSLSLEASSFNAMQPTASTASNFSSTPSSSYIIEEWKLRSAMDLEEDSMVDTAKIQNDEVINSELYQLNGISQIVVSSVETTNTTDVTEVNDATDVTTTLLKVRKTKKKKTLRKKELLPEVHNSDVFAIYVEPVISDA